MVGVPPNIGVSVFLFVLITKDASDSHSCHVRVLQNFLLVLKGAVNLKRLKNYALRAHPYLLHSYFRGRGK